MKGFSEFPDDIKVGAGQDTCGDVLSHLFTSTHVLDGRVHCSLLPNPSHLEVSS